MTSRPGPVDEAQNVGVDRRQRPQRRVAILQAATRLFLEHGFHGVGVDAIGEAAGITGPGVYTHFPSKEAILMAIFDAGGDPPWEPPPVRDGMTPEEALKVLVRAQVRTSLHASDVYRLWEQEQWNIPDAARRRYRRRTREYLQLWSETVGRCRPDLDDDQARTVAFGIMHMADSVGRGNRPLPPADAEELMVDLAVAAVTPSRPLGRVQAPS